MLTLFVCVLVRVKLLVFLVRVTPFLVSGPPYVALKEACRRVSLHVGLRMRGSAMNARPPFLTLRTCSLYCHVTGCDFHRALLALELASFALIDSENPSLFSRVLSETMIPLPKLIINTAVV